MKILTDRKEMAQALNFGKYPVLQWDIDNRKGSKAVVIKKSERYGDMRCNCTLYQGKIKEDDGIFWLMKHGTMLSAHVGVDDWIKNADYANAPVIESDQEVAVLCYSRLAKTSFVALVNSGRVTPDYSTAASFE